MRAYIVTWVRSAGELVSLRQVLDAPAHHAMQRALMLPFMLTPLCRGTPEALLEPPNLSKTPARAKSHPGFPEAANLLEV